MNSLFLGAGVAERSGLYGRTNRAKLLDQLKCHGVRSRAELLYAEVDMQEELKKEALARLVAESKKHRACKLMRTAPGIGPVYAARVFGTVGTPHRFRSRGAFWSYCGLAVVHRSSGTTQWGRDGRPFRNNKKVTTLGLNRNNNAALKEVFKSAAVVAISCDPEFKKLYDGYVERGLKESIARVHVARKLATIVLTIWKKGEKYDPTFLKRTTDA